MKNKRSLLFLIFIAILLLKVLFMNTPKISAGECFRIYNDEFGAVFQLNKTENKDFLYLSVVDAVTEESYVVIYMWLQMEPVFVSAKQMRESLGKTIEKVECSYIVLVSE